MGDSAATKPSRSRRTTRRLKGRYDALQDVNSDIRAVLAMAAARVYANDQVGTPADDRPIADDTLHAGIRAAKGLFNVLHPDIPRTEQQELLASAVGGTEQLARGINETRAEIREGERLEARAVKDIARAVRPLIRFCRKRGINETKESVLQDAGDKISRAMLAAFDRACLVPEELPEDAARARAVLSYVFDLYNTWIHPQDKLDYQPTDFGEQFEYLTERENVRKMFDLTLVNAHSLQEAQGRVLCEFAYSAREVEIFRQLAARLAVDSVVVRKATVYWTRKAIGSLFSAKVLSTLHKDELDIDPRSGLAPGEAYSVQNLDLAWSALSLWYTRGRKRKTNRLPEKWAEMNRLLSIAGLESRSSATLEATWKSFKADKSTELKRARMTHLEQVVDDRSSRAFVKAAVSLGMEEFRRLDEARRVSDEAVAKAKPRGRRLSGNG